MILFEVLICSLAAAGLILIAWAILGSLLLPAHQNCVHICHVQRADDVERCVRAYLWLHASGLVKGQLVLLDLGLDDIQIVKAKKFAQMYDMVVYCTVSTLQTYLELEF